MAVQWYPGHMHKAQKEIKQILPTVDLVIEVLDARIPYSSENPAISTMRGDKPCIKVLSKTDLADPELTLKWQAYLEQEQGVKTFPTTTEQPAKIKQIADLCRKMLPEKEASIKSINTLIVGIPNVGKSTLINTLADRIIAQTGNVPAVTKAQQRINLGSGIVLFDTPGILWPKIENENSSYRLAASGAIKDTAMDYEDVGFYLAEYLIAAYPDLMKERFGLDELGNSEVEFLEYAAAKRGALRSGGKVNLHKICEVLVNELRSGMLGRITLESPAMTIEEEKHVAAELARKASEKELRKQRFKDGSETPTKREQKSQKQEISRNRRRRR